VSDSTPGPTITRAASSVQKPRKFFVNLPVTDLQRAIRFFEALEFSFNPDFTDATATCMLVGEDAYVMLLTEARFKEFSKRPLGDRTKETHTLLAISASSREEVDHLVKTAVAAGGMRVGEPQDLGFMYSVSFRDLDGHTWEPFWMDPEAVG
jgi:predicted lactoylglutathione lyase